MAKGYWVIRIDVTDRARYDAYRTAANEALRPYGGRFLVRGGSFEAPEGRSRSRNVVIEFPSYQAAVDCYHSPEYHRTKAMRKGIAEFDLIVVEGYDGQQP
ncbi:MAG: DUF1330 domain-containing protein [Bauldia sp.]